jgi:hypothetical protein
MSTTEWIDSIVYFYDQSWHVMAFVYGATWALSISKKIMRNV